MKKFFTKIILAMAVFSVGMGFNFLSVAAIADELVEDVTSSDVLDNDVQSSTANDSAEGEEVVEYKTTDENSANNELENNEDTGEEKEETSHDFEDFLTWVQNEADRYGYGDEFSTALEAIRAAATQKQVTLSTIGSLAMMLAIVAYTVYKKVTDKKFKDEVHSLSESLNTQLEKLKELVDGTNSNTQTEEEIKAEEKVLKEETTKIKNGLENLINGFMHFTSHVGMTNVNKAEVQRDCIKALKSIDGEVTADENNEK